MSGWAEARGGYLREAVTTAHTFFFFEKSISSSSAMRAGARSGGEDLSGLELTKGHRGGHVDPQPLSDRDVAPLGSGHVVCVRLSAHAVHLPWLVAAASGRRR